MPPSPKMSDIGHADAKLRDPLTLELRTSRKSRLAKPVSYLFVGFSTEQVKLLALLVSPEPLYHAFCG
jgi:hypothetical protein